MRAFTCTGEFWLPGNEANTFEGTLSFDPREGARLDPGGVSEFFSQTKDRVVPLVLGKVKIVEDEPPLEVTLYKVYPQGGYPWPVKCIFQGAHFVDEKDLVFRRISLSFLPPVDMCHQKKLPNYATVTVNLKSFSVVTISFEKSRSFDECVLYFGKLVELLTLLFPERTVSGRIVPCSLSAENDAEKSVEILHAHPIFRDERSIGWLIEPLKAPKAVEEKFGEAFNKLFRRIERLQELRKLEESGELKRLKKSGKVKDSTTLERKLKFLAKLDFSMDLHFSAVYNRGSSFMGNLELPFFLLVTAAECYHSARAEKGTFSPKEDNPDFKEIDELVRQHKGLSEEAREFWNERGEELVRKPLRLQLEDIYNRWQKTADVLDFLRDEKLRNKFFSRVRDYRADIAHGRKGFKTAELLEAFYRLRLFLELCLLGELGFTPEECKEIIKEAWYYQFRKLPSAP